MKVITLGKIPAPVVYRAKCERCNTLCEFAGIEAKRQWQPPIGTIVFVECPCCDRAIFERDWVKQ